MKSILGFSVGEPPEETPAAAQAESAEPVRSLVSVSFPDDGRTLTYYNDGFALEPGDRVFVEGKLAGRVPCGALITLTGARVRIGEGDVVSFGIPAEAARGITERLLSLRGTALALETDAGIAASILAWRTSLLHIVPVWMAKALKFRSESIMPLVVPVVPPEKRTTASER